MSLLIYKQHRPPSASSEMSSQHLAGGKYIQTSISSNSALNMVWSTVGVSHQDITADTR